MRRNWIESRCPVLSVEWLLSFLQSGLDIKCQVQIVYNRSGERAKRAVIKWADYRISPGGGLNAKTGPWHAGVPVC